MKYAAIAVACMAASSVAQAAPLIDEGFESFAGLSGAGWVVTNESSPVGSTGLFQGDSEIFAAQAGAADSYVAGNFNATGAGGTLSVWLITPEFSTATDVVVTFYARADIFEPFFDKISYGFSSGSSSTADFTLSAATTVGGGWTQYTGSIAAQGAGSVARFAIAYVGNGDDANYIGLDTLTVNAVPEPSTWLMFGAGLAGLAALARRRVQAQG